MERMPSFEYRRSRESIAERFLALSERDFERNFGIPERQVERFSYSPERNRYTPVAEFEPKRGLEVLVHKETSTLIVPPPTLGTISIGDLATMSLPVVGYIEQQQPDVVVGCDRGARVYALAVHSMWSNLKADEQRFPTLDAKLHFARLSTSLGLDITSQALADIITASKEEAKRQGKGFNGKRPRIMFIDDWVSSGRTRQHILHSLEAIGVLPKVDVSFVVMCGPGADATGRKDRVSVPWHDNPEVIGVNYTSEGRPFPVRTDEAKKIRRSVHRATRELAAKLK